MNIYVEPARNFTEEIKYTWELLASNASITYRFVDDPAQANISIDSTPNSDLPVATGFYDALSTGRFDFTNFFNGDCLVKDALGRNDYLATAFYMVNSLQEHATTELDEIGRFRYRDSYQCRFNCATDNLVQDYFQRLLRETPKLSAISPPARKSAFFLSHDIDSVYGALLQDGYYLFRKRQPHLIWSVIVNAVLQRPDWLNMDKIMSMEDEYDFRSTFFWIVNRGRINKREVNADYSIQSKVIQDTIQRIASRGWENGLHKSISPETLQEEMVKTGFSPVTNRYHYLKFTLPAMYDRVEEGGLKMDASLGFAETCGFRNSYGLPFAPFNLKSRKKYNFLEVPLNLMDGTFQQYQKVPRDMTADQIIAFMEKNNRNCLLSLLWHNTFFTDHKYGGYGDVYKKILSYLYEGGYSCLNPSQIIRQYGRG